MRDLVAAELDGTDAAAIDDADDLEWRVFYDARETREAARQTLEPFARAHELTVGSLEVEDGDWARRSQAALTAVRVGDIVVAPPWDRARRRRGARRSRAAERERAGVGPREQEEMQAGHFRDLIEIVIEPSWGFGTGHHASTRLCLRAMQQLDLRGKSVIDVGTGSGVLAIAAVKLGAARVTAIDTDPDAVASARENGARNQVVVDWYVADVAAADGPSARGFDVVLANLTGAWLRRLSRSLGELASRGGICVFAGLQTSERDRVLEAFLPSSRLEHELEEDGWSALVLTRTHP